MKSVRAFLIGANSSHRFGRHLQRLGLRLTQQRPVALAGLFHRRQKLTVPPIDQRDFRADGLPHHAKQVMRLIAGQRNRLPLPQRVIYIESDLCT